MFTRLGEEGWQSEKLTPGYCHDQVFSSILIHRPNWSSCEQKSAPRRKRRLVFMLNTRSWEWKKQGPSVLPQYCKTQTRLRRLFWMHPRVSKALARKRCTYHKRCICCKYSSLKKKKKAIDLFTEC